MVTVAKYGLSYILSVREHLGGSASLLRRSAYAKHISPSLCYTNNNTPQTWFLR